MASRQVVSYFSDSLDGWRIEYICKAIITHGETLKNCTWISGENPSLLVSAAVAIASEMYLQELVRAAILGKN